MTMMQDDWGQWQQEWHQPQPVPDIERLQRKVRRKHWRMAAVVALGGLTTLFAVAQLIRLQLFPQLPLRWHVAGFAMLGLVAVLQWFFLHSRRGTWRLAAADSRGQLELSARRARAGIRLAWLQVWAVLVLVMIVVIAAWPWLQSERWQHDPHLRLLLALQIGVNGPIMIGGVVSCFWYIRRQRLSFQRLEAWLRE